MAVREKTIIEGTQATLADIVSHRKSDDVIDFVFTGKGDIALDTAILRVFSRVGGTLLETITNAPSGHGADAASSKSRFTITDALKQAWALASADFARKYYYEVEFQDDSASIEQIWFRGNYVVDV